MFRAVRALAFLLLLFPGTVARADSMRMELYRGYLTALTQDASASLDDTLSDRIRDDVLRAHPERAYDRYPSDRILAHFDVLADSAAKSRRAGTRLPTAIRAKRGREFIARAHRQAFLFRQWGSYDPYGFVDIVPVFPEMLAASETHERYAILQFWAIATGVLVEVLPEESELRARTQAQFLSAFRDQVAAIYRTRMTDAEVAALEQARRMEPTVPRFLRAIGEYLPALVPPEPVPILRDYIPHSMEDSDVERKRLVEPDCVSRYKRDLEAMAALLLEIRRPVPDYGFALTLELLDNGPTSAHEGIRPILKQWLSGLPQRDRDRILLTDPAGRWALAYLRGISFEEIRGVHQGKTFEEIADLLELAITPATLPRFGFTPEETGMLKAAAAVKSIDDLTQAIERYIHYKSYTIVCSQGMPNYHLELAERRLREHLLALPCSDEMEKLISDRYRLHYGALKEVMAEKIRGCDGLHAARR